MTKLTDLNPHWIGSGGDGVSRIVDGERVPVPRREGVYLGFDCPCGCGSEVAIQMRNPLDGGDQLGPKHPSWERTGEDFETLTLAPSIQRNKVMGKGCEWHGFIENGLIRTV